jgi:DNA-binding NarL/FixJ family response regulator
VTLRVLLLDDEYDTRDLLGRALDRAGYEVTATATGEQALDFATQAHAPDVIVADVVIGKDDRRGLRLLAELRARGVRAPIIVITAFADLEKAKTALNEGAAYLLEKPFSAAELIDAIARVTARDDPITFAETLFSRAALTDKERAVGRHLLAGLSSEEIAAREGNSPKTIRQHITQIYSKCGVASRAEFLRLMLTH